MAGYPERPCNRSDPQGRVCLARAEVERERREALDALVTAVRRAENAEAAVISP